jgi:hypothetical protein
LTLRQEAIHQGPDWEVQRQALTLTTGGRWTCDVDPVALALVSGADGRTTVRDQLPLLAAAYDLPEADLARTAAGVVRHLVERGFVVPVDLSSPKPRSTSSG